MDTALPQKFSLILDRNLAKANCTEDRVCTSYDKVVFDQYCNIYTVVMIVRRGSMYHRQQNTLYPIRR